MRKIKTIEDLHAERMRLRIEVELAEEVLRGDLEIVKEELKPENILAGIARRVMGNAAGGVLNKGAGFVIDILLRKVVLSKAGWVTKIIVPLVAKTLFSNYALKNNEEIFGFLRDLVRKARNFTNGRKEYYDKSTVDEMDF